MGPGASQNIAGSSPSKEQDTLQAAPYSILASRINKSRLSWLPRAVPGASVPVQTLPVQLEIISQYPVKLTSTHRSLNMHPEQFQPLKKKSFFIYFFLWYECFACIHVCVTSAYGVQERAEYSPKLDLQMVVSHHVGAEN